VFNNPQRTFSVVLAIICQWHFDQLFSAESPEVSSQKSQTVSENSGAVVLTMIGTV
jgi:hypothetical protein